MKIFIKLKFRRRILFLSQVMFSVTLLLREERNDSSLLKNLKESNRMLRQADDWLNWSRLYRKGFVVKHFKEYWTFPLRSLHLNSASFFLYFRYCGLCIPRVCSRTPFETSPLCQVQNIHTYYDHSLLFVKISILFRYSGRGPWKIQEVRSPHLRILAGSLTFSTVFIMFRPASHPFFKLLRLSDALDDNVFGSFFALLNILNRSQVNIISCHFLLLSCGH